MSILSEDLDDKPFSITEKDLIKNDWTPYRLNGNYTYEAFIKCIHSNNIILGHVEIYKETLDEWRLDCYYYIHSTHDKYASCMVKSMENLMGCVNQFENFIKINNFSVKFKEI